MKTKEVRGITIISLVITIVVLLILAGVSVSLVIGNNNLFDKAKSTQKIQTIAGIKEALELEKADIQVESKTVNLENYLEQISTGRKNYDLSSTEKIDNKNAYIIINDQYKFLLKDKENGDVEITYEGVAVSGDLTLSSYEGTYTYPNSGSFEITNNASGGELTVNSDAPNIATVSLDGNTVTVKPGTTSGKATITVTSAEASNYNAKSATYTATVNNGTISLSATPYTGTYDGKEHNAITSVTVNPSDAKLEYSINGGPYNTTMPTITDSSSFTVTVKASKAGYATRTATETVKVNKAEGKLTLSATSGISTNGDNLTFTVSGNTGTLSVASSDTNIAIVSISGSTVTVKPGTTVGTAAITVTSAATTNYNMKSATYIATIKPKFNVSSGVGYYADVDDDGIVDGVIFGDFKEGGSGKWGSVPFYPELSSYSIPTTSSTKNYYVSQSNYDGVFGSKPVLSTKDSGNSRFWVMSLNDLSSSTYSRSYATDFSRNGWKIPSKTQWLAFAAKMGVTKENYGQLGLKSEYWTSTLDKRDDPDNPNAYTIDFTQAYIRSWFMADKYIRLATTF